MIFAVVSITVTSAAVMAIIVNSRSTGRFALGEDALNIAESGADNAVLHLLRDTNYSGETLSMGNGTANISVTGSSTKTVISEGVSGTIHRKIQVVGTFSNNVFSINSWNEIQ